MKMKNSDAGPEYWKNQVRDFCGIFGFRLDRTAKIDLSGRVIAVFSIKAGRSTVAYKDEKKTWRSREMPLAMAIDCVNSGRRLEKAMKDFMEFISGKELIIRSSDKDRKTPYGFTKVRLIRHITLPEFGSVEELKLKLAVSEDGEP